MTEVIGVRFRGGCKSYYFDPKGLQVEKEQAVIVETAQGTEYGICAESNHMVDERTVVQPLRPVLRLATENDQRTVEYNRRREREAFDICEKKILEHKLDMKLVRVEYSFDGSKILFFFTADGRVDFRELVKNLAAIFHARIELRQVGVRDETKMLGGLGICGRPLCCADFLEEFLPVSIKMAKTQGLSLNPTKISGACGRLMCCLKYEQEAYEDAARRMPKNESFVQTPDGTGDVCEVNLLKEEVRVRLDGSNDTPRCYKNCELCVLRNGKGGRDGIEIPAQRPARFVPDAEGEEPLAREPVRISSHPLQSDFVRAEQTERTDAPMEEKEQRRRRRRGGRRSGGEKTGAPAAQQGNGAEKNSRGEKKLERPEEKRGGEKRQEHPPRRREISRPSSGGAPAEIRSVASQNPQQVDAAQRKVVVLQAEGTVKSSGSRRRHRGGRRRGGQGGGQASSGTGNNSQM